MLYFRVVLQTLYTNSQTGVEWIDLVFPTKEELAEVAGKYQLPANLVQDCLEPNHLPKFEVAGKTTFAIIRAIDVNAKETSDSIQEVTKKIAIFYVGHTVITIHRREETFLFDLKDYFNTNNHTTAENIVLAVIRKGILSYDMPIMRADAALDVFETRIFLKRKNPHFIRDSYYLKRKLDVYRRMLLMTKDIILKISDEGNFNKASIEDLKDNITRVLVDCEQVRENLNQLLNIHFNLDSQRGNEVVRVLTIFSVFFIPLTFIVGIYGMNFKFMPELDWEYGYLSAWVVMVVVVLIIFQWLKRKKWM